MSSLITIDDNNLIYKLNDISKIENKKIKIISVIGKARTGKSTLMNIIISKWLNKNITIFKMSDAGEHCTNGVDYYYVEEKNILLLDFQGIYLGDSSQDSKLLLLSYLLSDIIIFNENKMLTNNTLSQFEPMLSFMHYVSNNDLKKYNPKLIFRISDVNLDIEPTSNMQQMLSYHNDQFQSIRDSINNLFDEPFAINTNNLDRKEFTLLNNNNFIEVLKENDNGFNNAIQKITDYIECCNYNNTLQKFIKNIKIIVEYINQDTRIDFTKLDIVQSIAKYEILEYIRKIDDDIYKDIDVDGTEELYQNNLVSRIKQKDNIIEDIYKKFSSIPKNIIDEELQKFTDKINPVIEKANKTNLIDTLDIFEYVIKDKFNYKDNKIFKMTYTFKNSSYYDEWINNLKDTIASIQKDTSNLYNKVISTTDNIMKEFLDNIYSKYILEKERIDNINEKYTNLLIDYCNNLDNNYIKIIDDTYEIEPHLNIDTYFKEFIKTNKDNIENIIINPDNKDNIINEFNIYINIDKLILKIFLELGYNNYYQDSEDSKDYIKYKYTTKNKISEYLIEQINIYSDEVEKIITKHKNEIYSKIAHDRERILTELKGTMLKEKNISKIIENNPHINFVSFEYYNKKYIMTEKYFTDSFKIDLHNVKQICTYIEKINYNWNWNKFIKDITTLKMYNNTELYEINFMTYKNKYKDDIQKMIFLELFELEFKKYYARGKFIFEF